MIFQMLRRYREASGAEVTVRGDKFPGKSMTPSTVETDCWVDDAGRHDLRRTGHG